MASQWQVTVDSPLGPFSVFGDDTGLRSSGFVTAAAEPGPIVNADPHGAGPAFTAYFAGDLSALHGLPLAPRGTDFQQRVWAELQRIPPGSAITYAELAARIGRPKATRAVGTANGRNPLGVVIPCHRVVARDGRLGGYTGGLDRKRWLLAHEKAPGYLVP